MNIPPLNIHKNITTQAMAIVKPQNMLGNAGWSALMVITYSAYSFGTLPCVVRTHHTNHLALLRGISRVGRILCCERTCHKRRAVPAQLEGRLPPVVGIASSWILGSRGRQYKTDTLNILLPMRTLQLPVKKLARRVGFEPTT